MKISIIIGGMKAVIIALFIVSSLGPVKAWDEDPRCTCDRRKLRISNGLQDEFDPDTIIPNNFDKKNDDLADDPSSNKHDELKDFLMHPINSSRSLQNSPPKVFDTIGALSKGSDYQDGLMIQPHNSSDVLLRGGTNDEQAHRQLQSSFDFQIKMHWEVGYCWQCEWRERKWCWQCEGGNCNEGDKIQVRVCSGSSRQRFVYSRAGGGRVRISPETRRDLCLEMRSEKRANLQKCDSGDRDQEFSGFDDDGSRFELFPAGQDERCMTQQHDPKSYEEVFADTCRTARGDRTNYWVVYKPKGSDRPNPSPTPRPQQEPTPTSSSSCIYDLNLRDNGFLQDGQRLRSPDDSDLYLEQRDNGLLAIRDNGRTIWDSGAYGREGDYWTQLQRDGNLITWRGKPKEREDRVWKSNRSDRTGDYFVGLDCDKRYVGIYEGTSSRPGDRIWKERTGVSSAPAPTPTGSQPTPTSGRKKIKYYSSNYCTPSNKCGLCEGDCDKDSDCEGNLVCKQRDERESFSGCSGGGSDNSAADYCVEP